MRRRCSGVDISEGVRRRRGVAVALLAEHRIASLSDATAAVAAVAEGPAVPVPMLLLGPQAQDVVLGPCSAPSLADTGSGAASSALLGLCQTRRKRQISQFGLGAAQAPKERRPYRPKRRLVVSHARRRMWSDGDSPPGTALLCCATPMSCIAYAAFAFLSYHTPPRTYVTLRVMRQGVDEGFGACYGVPQPQERGNIWKRF